MRWVMFPRRMVCKLRVEGLLCPVQSNRSHGHLHFGNTRDPKRCTCLPSESCIEEGLWNLSYQLSVALSTDRTLSALGSAIGRPCLQQIEDHPHPQ